MPCPQGVSLGIPPVAASACSSRLSGTTCISFFPSDLSREAEPPPPLLVFGGVLFLLDKFFGFHPCGWRVIRRRTRRAKACAYGCYCLLRTALIVLRTLRHKLLLGLV